MSAFGQHLGERDGDVTGARRQVAQQEVQIAPVHVGEELLQGAVQHRPAPDDGALGIDEEPDGDDLAAVRLQRHDEVLEGDRPPRDAHHAGDRVTPDVGVEDADLAALTARAPPRGSS
jgi:hypothetical protein